MTQENFNPKRRELLAALAGAGMSGLFMSAVGSRSAYAQAADFSDYKALVCVFSRGGMDHNDTILPFDQPHYDQMASVRQTLMNAYATLGTDASRARSTLLPLTPSDQLATEGRKYAVPRELAPLRELFNEEELVFIGSVGALVEPTDRNSYESRSVKLPPALFSHNDQQNYWQGLEPEGARTGWGGRFMDSLHARNMVGDERFGAISTSGTNLFSAAIEVPSYVIPPKGPSKLAVERVTSLLGSEDEMNRVRQKLSTWFRAEYDDASSMLGSDYQQLQRESMLAGDDYELEFTNSADFGVSFPVTAYGKRLKNVAKSIRIANAFGMKRQIFFVDAGGFDTHANQHENLPGMQASLASSVKAFRDAMVEIGMWNNVAVFSAADFGRTLIENGPGTDHGWGGHHFITGGSVRGGRMLGRFPAYDFNGPEYTKSRARLIPSVAIEQYSATLGDWFGVDSASIQYALPNLSNFSQRSLDVFA